MKVYIAGPMTGIQDLNFPAFHSEAAKLRAQGHEVINPAEINPDHTMPWAECMRRDIAALVTCDAIHLLPGWEASKGAALEHHIAERLGLEIQHPDERSVKLIALAVATEREACARVCDARKSQIDWHNEAAPWVRENECIEIAEAIRARGAS